MEFAVGGACGFGVSHGGAEFEQFAGGVATVFCGGGLSADLCDVGIGGAAVALTAKSPIDDNDSENNNK